MQYVFHGYDLENKNTKNKKQKPTEKKQAKKLDSIPTLKYFYLKNYRHDFRYFKTSAYCYNRG